MSNAVVGRDDHLIASLASSFGRAERIRINVSFLMESGAKLIVPHLKAAAARGVTVRVLTGKYLSITEPPAIYLLRSELGENLDIRFFSDPFRSFHPKSYIIDYSHDSEVFVGSSNLSRAALTTGIEWNYRFLRSEHPADYRKFSRAFDELFEKHSEVITGEVLRSYSAGWRKSRTARAEEETTEDGGRVEPRGAQIEALYELKAAREEGVTRGMVVAATGVGKTYLSAFDSAAFKKILFVAHRQEILEQAEESFRRVRPGLKTGYYTGYRKDKDADAWFATVQTLSLPGHRAAFPRDYFDYIIVDEFHHAASDIYLSLLGYFEPRFLLGLTATPYRMDNRDIYALCEDNVIYEIHLKDAINRDLLVPFKYYGVYDEEVDYGRVGYRNGRYVVEDLERELSTAARANLVLGKYRQYAGARTLGFCASIKHAEDMARYFNGHGVAAAAVHSLGGMDRKEAVRAITEGRLRVIFVVDLFNEGVDIPSIDTVMFLRPTESFVVFLQQLGRGLRKHEGKTHLTVLDFIGNYRHAHYVPALLAGDNPLDPKRAGRRNPADYEYPEGCQVQFDFRVLDLFEEMAKRDPLKVRMRDEYFRLKDALGRRPNRLDVYEGSDIPFRNYREKGWLGFLAGVGEITAQEEGWLGTPVEVFLKFLEKTSMTKSYKIPTIMALLENDRVLPKVSLERIGEVFADFYRKSLLHQKDLRDKSNADWKGWGEHDFMKLARKNPVHFLSRSRFFNYDEINRVFYLSPDLEPYLSPALAGHIRDILEYRRIDYFRRRFREEE